VRELEQAVRCVILNHHYCSEIEGWCEALSDGTSSAVQDLQVSAQGLLSAYCKTLYEKYKTYEKVAEITHLDPRTVKKHIQHHPE